MTRPNQAIQALLQATRPDPIGARYAERTQFSGPAVNRAGIPWRLGKIVDGTATKGDKYPLDRNAGVPYGYWFAEIDRLNQQPFVGSLTRDQNGVDSLQIAVVGMGRRNQTFVPLPVDGTCLIEVLVTQPAAPSANFPIMQVIEAVYGDDKNITVCQDLNRIDHLKPDVAAYTITIPCGGLIVLDAKGHVLYLCAANGTASHGPREHNP